MAAEESFTIVDYLNLDHSQDRVDKSVTDGNQSPLEPSLYTTYETLTSSKIADLDIQLTAALREAHPHQTLTVVPARNIPLLTFAALGHATATLNTDTDRVVRWRGYIPAARRGESGRLGDAVFYAQYLFVWGKEEFLLYTVSFSGNVLQYILKSPDSAAGETAMGHSGKVDALLLAAMKVLLGDESKFVWVYDRYWSRSRALWEEVQKADWDKVILDEGMKSELQDVAARFFDSREIYKRYGVPWKRGLIFYGPPGNGKTISLKALMKTLYGRKESVPTLYVKSAPQVYNIQAVFSQARLMSPCVLAFEDIETIVTPNTRSYFLNEVDGLANNDGILMIASTNYLDRIDPGLSQRPSRFDRKYLFPLPNMHERTLYAAFWQSKLHTANPSLAFPDALCPAMAGITGGFSFAYMQEAFVASLLQLAKDETTGGVRERYGSPLVGAESVTEKGRDREGRGSRSFVGKGKDKNKSTDDSGGNSSSSDDDKKDPLDQYKLWRVFKKEVKALREQIGNGPSSEEPPASPGNDDDDDDDDSDYDSDTDGIKDDDNSEGLDEALTPIYNARGVGAWALAGVGKGVWQLLAQPQSSKQRSHAEKAASAAAAAAVETRLTELDHAHHSRSNKGFEQLRPSQYTPKLRMTDNATTNANSNFGFPPDRKFGNGTGLNDDDDWRQSQMEEFLHGPAGGSVGAAFELEWQRNPALRRHYENQHLRPTGTAPIPYRGPFVQDQGQRERRQLRVAEDEEHQTMGMEMETGMGISAQSPNDDQLLRSVGVGKSQYFAKTAFETRL